MSNRPKGWLAALLTFFFQPIGFLYVGSWKWAISTVAAATVFAVLQFTLFNLQPWVPVVGQLIFNSVLARIAYVQAKDFAVDRVRPGYSKWYGLWAVALLFLSLIVVVRAFLFEPFHVPAGSMQPSLPVGAKLIVKKWGYGNYATFGFGLMRTSASASVYRGDIVVFDFPPDPKLQYVKRIVGLPGDKVEYRSKTLTINGQEIGRRSIDEYFDETSMRHFSQYVEKLGISEYPILLNKDLPAFIAGQQVFKHSENCTYFNDGVTCLVPEGHYYVLGDNRDNSLDSRYWGFVPQDHLIGKVAYVFP